MANLTRFSCCCHPYQAAIKHLIHYEVQFNFNLWWRMIQLEIEGDDWSWAKRTQHKSTFYFNLPLYLMLKVISLFCKPLLFNSTGQTTGTSWEEGELLNQHILWIRDMLSMYSLWIQLTLFWILLNGNCQDNLFVL